VLRGIFGPKRGEVTEGYGRANKEQIHNLYSLPHTIRMIKLNERRWMVHVMRMGRSEMRTKYRLGSLKTSEKLGAGGSITLK
jgi:hypothetical protein